MSRQPLAASPEAAVQPSRVDSGGPATASTRAAASTSGRCEIAATAASCSSGPIRTWARPDRPRQVLDPPDGVRVGRAWDDDPRSTLEQVGLRAA